MGVKTSQKEAISFWEEFLLREEVLQLAPWIVSMLSSRPGWPTANEGKKSEKGHPLPPLPPQPLWPLRTNPNLSIPIDSDKESPEDCPMLDLDVLGRAIQYIRQKIVPDHLTYPLLLIPHCCLMTLLPHPLRILKNS